MRYSVTTSVAPPVEPITLAEAKLHLRVDTGITDQDTLITGLIRGARGWVESYCRRSLVQRTLVLRMDNWHAPILLPKGEVRSVSQVQYVDAGGATQTLAADQYQVDTYSVPARIVPAYGVVWPVVKTGEINAVLVTYVAGYAPDESGSPTDFTANVPDEIKSAMKLLIGTLYENRETISERQSFKIPFTLEILLAPYEIRDFRLEQ